jgi:chromosome segregation ATPase
MLGRPFGITRPTKDDVEAIENALSRIPLTISAATQKLLDVKQVRIENLETDNEVLAEKLAEFERTRGELELRLSNAESDIASLRKQIEDLEAR